MNTHLYVYTYLSLVVYDSVGVYVRMFKYSFTLIVPSKYFLHRYRKFNDGYYIILYAHPYNCMATSKIFTG